MGQSILKRRFSLMRALRALVGAERPDEKVKDDEVEQFNQNLSELQKMLAEGPSNANYIQSIREDVPVNFVMKRPNSQSDKSQQQKQAQKARGERS